MRQNYTKSVKAQLMKKPRHTMQRGQKNKNKK